MRKRSNIRDLFHHDAGGVDGTDSGLTSLTRSLHINFHFAQTEVVSNLGTVLSHHLGSVGSILFRTSVSHLTSGRPRNHLTVVIGKGNDNIIKGSIDKRLSGRIYSDNFLLG